ncbi:hypothetical protein HY993_02370 [Candidatus Micrarchaeota archaeon]|nr:hypothetical protein [Candidatus Micrarchaeota archaeon]
MDYSIEREEFSIQKTGHWEEIADLDAKLFVKREDEEEKPTLAAPSNLSKYVPLLGLVGALLLFAGFLANDGGIGLFGFLLLVLFVLFWWKRKSPLSREIIILMTGEVRRSIRSKRIGTKLARERGTHSRSVEEAYLASDLQIRVAGSASEEKTEDSVREDIKDFISKIRHDFR